MNIAKKASLALVILFGWLTMLGSQSSTPQPEPTITAFEVLPSQVCLNQGTPLVQVNYSFDPDGWQNENTLCTVIKANGQVVHPQVRHQCLDDGTSGSYNFNLTTQFGTNVPPNVTVSVELLPLVDNDAYDVRSASVEAIVNCPPPGGIPD